MKSVIGGACRMYGRVKNTYRFLIGKPDKGQLGRRRHRWEDNIRMDVREIGWEDVDWMHVAGCCERCN
jgi:hypothetical protein